ncbi:MAG: DUF4230 domain-containing protein [Anaerolineaceae bacterium]|nr:DUF4230 domain-containing protein [Anaerolineaceae bacterium]
MDRRKGAVFIGALLILAIIGVGMILVVKTMMENTVKAAVQPFEQANQTVQTKVAEFMHPTPTVIPDPVTIIQEVRSLARLETIQYSVEKVITAEIGQNELGFLFGDRLLFVGHGVVIGGIDLEKMMPEDLWIEGTIVYVRLPEPEVFVAALDNEKSYVYDRETGLLTKGDVNLEKTAREAAENEILKAAVDDGILDLARQNAENYLGRLLRGLGFGDVVFVEE